MEKSTMRTFVLAFLVIFTGLRSELCAEKIASGGTFSQCDACPGARRQSAATAGKRVVQERLGPDVEIQWFVYNAGPSAMEAIFANSIDLTYVGPNPALNAYVKSQGEEIRVIAGAAIGGAALVVHGEGGLQNPRDFKGKRIATPQLGNTQDVAARAWVKRNGFRITQLGGDVLVLPTANPDQLSLFQQKQVMPFGPLSLGFRDSNWKREAKFRRTERRADHGARVERSFSR